MTEKDIVRLFNECEKWMQAHPEVKTWDECYATLTKEESDAWIQLAVRVHDIRIKKNHPLYLRQKAIIDYDMMLGGYDM